MTNEERQAEHDVIESLMLARIRELSNAETNLYNIPEGSTRSAELAVMIENYKEFIKCRQFGRTISKAQMDEEVRTTEGGGDQLATLFSDRET